jgi:ArsR family transcriptional regulator, lead/cadmium/zinc/bismuth-responsive transcriptional repressor
MVRRSIFEKIFKEMQFIRNKLEDLENNIANLNPKPIEVSESSLIELPDHLRKTYIAVLSRGEINAAQVAGITARARALESAYLNQLVRMGYLNKATASNKTKFYSTLKNQHKTTIAATDQITSFNIPTISKPELRSASLPRLYTRK